MGTKKQNILTCPNCGSAHVQLWDSEKNMKTTSKTTLNLNPLKPFTVFNHKEQKKAKLSAAKVGLGLMTGGASLLVTGAHKDKHNEYHCMDCGNRWIGK